MIQKFILLVEDNSDDEALTIRALRKNNIYNRVVIAHDGAEALDFLYNTGSYESITMQNTPTLILLDLKLPRVDGLEVLKQIRSHPTTSHLPVVVLTSSREDKDITNCYKYGASSYIVKPVDFIRFMEIILTVGEYWLNMNEMPAEM